MWIFETSFSKVFCLRVARSPDTEGGRNPETPETGRFFYVF